MRFLVRVFLASSALALSVASLGYAAPSPGGRGIGFDASSSGDTAHVEVVINGQGAGPAPAQQPQPRGGEMAYPDAGHAAPAQPAPQGGIAPAAAPTCSAETPGACTDPFSPALPLPRRAATQPAAQPPAAQPPAPPALTQAQVQSIALSAASQLTVPAPQIGIHPNPTDNEWGAVPVGLPIWLTAGDTGSFSQQTNASGITIDMTATPGQATFDMGDGSVVSCSSWTPRPGNEPPQQESPVCGHTYKTKGSYTISVNRAWTVNWQAAGFSGTLPVGSSTSTIVVINELHSVVVR